jgi:hypothetical protein
MQGYSHFSPFDTFSCDMINVILLCLMSCIALFESIKVDHKTWWKTGKGSGGYIQGFIRVTMLLKYKFIYL